MNKFKEIRPIVLGIAIKDNKLLVGESYDNEKNQTFYRCLGAGIEFLEESTDALKREFKEELNADIVVKDFLGVFENIFTYTGKNAHEIVFFYSIEIPDKYYKDEYKIIDQTNHVAKWIDISEFKNGEKILYPTGTLKYIKNIC